MDRFHELSAFLAVVETGGFTAAARRMGESQSSISKAIGSLERRLNVKLFNRSTRSVTLTDLGMSYFHRTKPLIEEMAAAESELVNNNAEVGGPIRIAVASTFGRLHVLPLIPELLACNPGLTVDLVLSDAVRDMVDDRIDLAIRVGRVSEQDAVVHNIGSTPLICAGSRAYFERYGIPQVPSDLTHHNCLVYGGLSESANWPFVGPQGRFSVAVKGNLSSNSVESIRAGVLAGVGIGLFSKLSLVAELQSPDIITVLGDFLTETRQISVVWPSRRFVSSRVRRVTEFFSKALPGRI